MRALLVLLLSSGLALGLPPASLPSAVGRFSTWTNALPNSQLPDVPILGNGGLGALLDGRGSVSAGGRLDIWLGSGSFWSCGNCATLAKGCCRMAALGGIRLSPPPISGLEFAAEQRIAAGTLQATMTTPNGGVLTALLAMHPSDRLLTVNISWLPGQGEGDEMALNVSVWAEPASTSGAHPAPAAAGCAAPATGQAQTCAAGGLPEASAQIIFVSRQAATLADSPNPIWAAWAASIGGGAGAATFSSNSTSGDEFSATAAVHLSSTQPLSIAVAEVEAHGVGAGDPAPAAAAAAAATDRGQLRAAATRFWNDYWARSGIVLAGQPALEAMYSGAAYVLACTASVDPNTPPPALYGVWATSDNCAWNGDYTLDYNAEATLFGAFAMNHAAQAESYWQYLLDWQAPARTMAQQQAAALNISCDASALHYACHLAPWGYQSYDETFYMHWNGMYSSLLFINHFEYTLNVSFTREVILPFIAGHNRWWACALSKLALPGGGYAYHDLTHDAEHEGQVVPDPQIGLAFAARTLQAQLRMSAQLGVPPPADVADMAAHLTPFNVGNFSWVPPGNATYDIYPNERFSGDSGMHLGVATLAACEALCATLPACALFTFCANTSIPGCDDGQSCWQYTAAQFPTLHSGPGFVSGRKNASAPPQELVVWTAYAGAGVAQSDSFAIYPSWPTEALASTGAPMDARTASIAQASARAYVNFRGGRTVDVFSSAVAAGLGAVFAAGSDGGGGSVRTTGAAAHAVAISPAEVVAGFNEQISALSGGSLLIYAPGGGVENVGAARALCDMLVSTVGGLGGAIMLFPMWPADEPAAFSSLLTKGGVAVSAAYSNSTRRVASPVLLNAQHTWAGAPAARVCLYDPWGVGPTGGIAVSCAGISVPVQWNGDDIFSFDAPAGVDCAVALPSAAKDVAALS